jgi:hypothetical protein
VRDIAAGGPKAHLRLSPEVARAPHTAHEGGWPPALVQRRLHHIPAPNARYKVVDDLGSALDVAALVLAAVGFVGEMDSAELSPVAIAAADMVDGETGHAISSIAGI